MAVILPAALTTNAVAAKSRCLEKNIARAEVPEAVLEN